MQSTAFPVCCCEQYGRISRSRFGPTPDSIRYRCSREPWLSQVCPAACHGQRARSSYYLCGLENKVWCERPTQPGFTALPSTMRHHSGPTKDQASGLLRTTTLPVTQVWHARRYEAGELLSSLFSASVRGVTDPLISSTCRPTARVSIRTRAIAQRNGRKRARPQRIPCKCRSFRHPRS